MNILNDKIDQNYNDLHQIELVEQEKMEYKLIDTFLRTPGLKLWFYDPRKDLIQEVIDKQVQSGTAQLIITTDTPSVIDKDHYTIKDYVIQDYERKAITIDTNNVYFEALSFKTAQKRVNKWKAGKLKQLCNMRKPGNAPIKLW